MKKLQLYTIKNFVVRAFYNWTDGEDFFWLQKHWDKFNWQYSNEDELKNIKYEILAITHIYNQFASFAFSTNELDIKQLLIALEVAKEQIDLDEAAQFIIKNKSYVFSKLVNVFGGRDQLYRELVSITIDKKLPKKEALKYIDNFKVEDVNQNIDFECKISF